MNINSLLLIIAFFLIVFIGAMVFFRRPGATINQMFLALMIAAGVITLTRFGLSISYTYEQAYFWYWLNFLLPVFYIGILYFVLYLSEQQYLLKSRIFHIAAIGSTLMFATTWAVSPSLFFLPPIRIKWGWHFQNQQTQPLLLPFVAWISILLSIGIASVFLYKNKHDDTVKYEMLKITFLAVTTGWLEPIVLYFKTSFSWHYPPVFAFVAVFSCLVIGYAIRKYQMFILTPVTTAEHIVMTMTDGLLLVDDTNNIVWSNRSAETMLQYGDKELINLKLSSVDSKNGDLTKWIHPSGEEADPLQQVGYQETSLITKTGSQMPVSLAVSILTSRRNELKGFVIIFRNIKERIEKDEELDMYRNELEQLVEKRTRELVQTNRELALSREQLRFLSKRLVEAKETESKRIAQELHDELGQLLTSMKIELTLLNRRLKSQGSEFSDSIYRSGGLLDMNDIAIKSVRDITKGLRPPILDDIGLYAALQLMVSDFERRTHIRCFITKEIEDELYESSFATTVYRIVQESLTNVARHSDADSVSLALNEYDNTLHVVITDNGKGISEELAASSSSFGILGMMERARSFGGEVRLNVLNGGGTQVALLIPVKKRIDNR